MSLPPSHPLFIFQSSRFCNVVVLSPSLHPYLLPPLLSALLFFPSLILSLSGILRASLSPSIRPSFPRSLSLLSSLHAARALPLTSPDVFLKDILQRNNKDNFVVLKPEGPIVTRHNGTSDSERHPRLPVTPGPQRVNQATLRQVF